jgi:two-component system, sensor histidine kinase and response regulator
MSSFKLIQDLSNDIKVLYVEDHVAAREALYMLLETIFPAVLVASNGLEGLEVYEKNEIDLIITDINMPEIDGISMIEKIRDKNKEVKIVVFSAHEKIEYLSRCIELGVDGFLTKPLNQQKYFQTLYKVVEQIHTKKELNKYKEDLEQKVQEQLDELLETQKILEKNAKFVTMGEMIDAIAHQWKTPLSIIKMYVEVIVYNIEADKIDKDELITYMEKTNFQINHLFETIEEFRKFFRPNANLELVSVKTLLRSILLLLKDELIKHTIEINYDYADDYMIKVNQNEFKHVMINLIQNSKEAFIQNDIQTRKISVYATQEDDYIIIKLIDNAGGIPKNIISQIFTPHFTTKPEEGGTGIGLYLVKQILDKVHATIDAENHDQGVCFTMRIKSY